MRQSSAARIRTLQGRTSAGTAEGADGSAGGVILGDVIPGEAIPVEVGGEMEAVAEEEMEGVAAGIKSVRVKWEEGEAEGWL
ncbi:unnamed protein product [Closterium sp. NIES-53]